MNRSSFCGHDEPLMDNTRYGDLGDDFDNMYSAEASPADGSVVVCGNVEDLIAEWMRYLVTAN